MNLVEEFGLLNVGGPTDAEPYERLGSQDAFGELEPSTSGEQPLLSVETSIRQASRGRGQIVSLCCCNETLVVTTSRGFLLRYNWDEYGNEKVTEVEVTKAPDARVKGCFLDPSGTHLLLCLRAGGQLETHYLHRRWTKTRPLTKLRGVAITAVGWQKQPSELDAGATPATPSADAAAKARAAAAAAAAAGTADDSWLDATTGDVVIGTEGGVLQEVHVEEARRDHAVAPLLDLQDPHAAIRGLEQELLPGGRRLVLAATAAHLYVFTGSGSLAQVFATYQPEPMSQALEEALMYYSNIQSPQEPEPQVNVSPLMEAEVPSIHSQLHLLRPAGAPTAPPTRFAWLVGCVIYTGTLTLPQPRARSPTPPPATAAAVGASTPEPPAEEALHIASDGRLQVVEGAPSLEDEPLSMVLTEFHLVLLYADRVQAVNRVSGQVVEEVAFLGPSARGPLAAPGAAPQGITRDPATGSIYLHSTDMVHDLLLVNEARDMWKVYVAHGEYEAALRLCSGPAQRDAVYLQQAEAAFAAGDPVKAGGLLARIVGGRPPFEDLTLRLVECRNPAALQAFLAAKLEVLAPSDKAQATMVAAWLTELHLDTLNRALLQAGGEQGDDYRAAEVALRGLLAKHVEVLDLRTTTQLLASYGRLDDLRFFAACRSDHEAVLDCLMQQPHGALEALKVLRKPAVSVELAYKLAPPLMAAAPEATVDFWMSHRPSLDPRRLLPALLRLGEGPNEHGVAHQEALRYLHYAIDILHCRDCAVHNLALALHVLHDDEAPLLAFLAASRDAGGRPLFDPKYALRLVRERRRPRASVQLMCELGMFEDAVALALQEVDVEAAKAVASRPEDDDALSRRLWLAIARHVVEGGGGGAAAAAAGNQAASIKQAVDFLREAGGLLKIEDILPFFPDFATIDNFKAAICDALERYSAQIAALKAHMDSATAIADAVRRDLAALGTRAAVLPSRQRCTSCGRLLTEPPPPLPVPSGGSLQPLFAFPTGLAYHGACCAAEVRALAGPQQAARISALCTRLANTPAGSSTAPAFQHSHEEPVSRLQAQLEELVAAECPRNGEVTVRLVDLPFVPQADLLRSTAEWAI